MKNTLQISVKLHTILKNSHNKHFLLVIITSVHTYLVDINFVQVLGSRQNGGALSVRKRKLLACEYAGIRVVIAHENGEA